MNLIERLEQTSPMSDAEIWDAQRDEGAGGEAWGGSLAFFMNERDGEFFIKDHYDDLGIMVMMAKAAIEDWWNFGVRMDPTYAWRVGIILGKAKRPDLRDRFDAAIKRHPYSRVSMLVPPEDHDERVRLQALVPRLQITCDKIVGEDGNQQMHFSFCCEDCGGWMLSAPRDDDPEGPIICKSCDLVLGLRKDMEALARHIGAQAMKAAP